MRCVRRLGNVALCKTCDKHPVPSSECHVSRIKDYSAHAVRGLGSGHFLLSLRYDTLATYSVASGLEGDTDPMTHIRLLDRGLGSLTSPLVELYSMTGTFGQCYNASWDNRE